MNLSLLSLILVIASIGAPPENVANHNAQRAKELALSADSVVLRGEREPAAKGIAIRDKEWIARFAEALSHTDFSKSDQVLGIGWFTAYFYSNGEQVLSVGLIEGYWLRTYSKKGGADFIVSEKQWTVIRDLIGEKMGANQRPETTPVQRPPAAPTPPSGAPQH
jgi:hypothetical protein